MSAEVPLPSVSVGVRRLKLVGNQRSPGLSGARNSGVVHADGELLAFCDDERLPDKLAHQVPLLARHLALAVSLRLVTAGAVVRLAHATGKGI